MSAELKRASYSGEAMLEYLGRTGARLVVVDGDAVCTEVGSPRVLNVALLGAALATGALGFTTAQLEAAIRESVRKKFVDMNIQALHAGARAAGAGPGAGRGNGW